MVCVLKIFGKEQDKNYWSESKSLDIHKVTSFAFSTSSSIAGGDRGSVMQPWYNVTCLM